MEAVVEYPVIDQTATGARIRELREARGMTVREVQSYFNFEMPQTIYKWEWGKNLPTLDHMYALAKLYNVAIEEIIVEVSSKGHGPGSKRKLHSLLLMVA